VTVLARTLRVHVYVTLAEGVFGATLLTDPCTSHGRLRTARSSARNAVFSSRRTDAENRVLPEDLSCRFMYMSIYTHI